MCKTQTLALAVNLPFCLQEEKIAHPYRMIADSKTKMDYMEAVSREIHEAAPEFQELPVSCVKIGGGSPTIMNSDRLGELIAQIRDEYPLSDYCEISVEALPNTICVPCLSGISKGKPNRFSLKVHSLQPRELLALNVPYTLPDIQNAVLFFDKFRVNNVGIELTLGIPGQTFISLKRTLRSCLELEPAHLMLRPYMNPMGTADRKLEKRMLASSDAYLREQGWTAYAPGLYCRDAQRQDQFLKHSWMENAVLGFGLDAYSCYEGVQYRNTRDLQKYLEHADDYQQLMENIQPCTEEQAQLRKLRGQLLLNENPRFEALPEAAKKETESFIEQGLILNQEGMLSLTPQGAGEFWLSLPQDFYY